MATHTMTTGTQRYSFLTKYMRRRALVTLQPNIELFRFGVEAIVPGGEGTHVFAPFYYDRSQAAGTFHESAIPGASAMSGHFFSASLAIFERVFRFTRHFWGTKTLTSMLEETTTQLTVSLAKGYEGAIQGVISNGATMSAISWVAADGATAYASVLDTTLLKARAFSIARKILRKRNCGGYSSLNNRFAAVINPTGVHHLTTALSGGLQLTMERASMNNTDAFRTAMVGDLFNCRIIESEYSSKAVFATNGMSAANSGYLGYVIAPGAFFVSPLAVAMPSVVIQGFGSGGSTGDPTNKIASIAVTGTFAAFKGPAAQAATASATTKPRYIQIAFGALDA